LKFPVGSFAVVLKEKTTKSVTADLVASLILERGSSIIVAFAVTNCKSYLFNMVSKVILFSNPPTFVDK